MFADDSHLSYASDTIPDIEQNLNQDVDSENKLTLHYSKTESMLMGSRERSRTLQSTQLLKIGGMPINIQNL